MVLKIYSEGIVLSISQGQKQNNHQSFMLFVLSIKKIYKPYTITLVCINY